MIKNWGKGAAGSMLWSERRRRNHPNRSSAARFPQFLSIGNPPFGVRFFRIWGKAAAGSMLWSDARRRPFQTAVLLQLFPILKGSTGSSGRRGLIPGALHGVASLIGYAQNGGYSPVRMHRRKKCDPASVLPPCVARWKQAPRCMFCCI